MRDQFNNSSLLFYATICHVCKRFGDGVCLKRCSGCRMISYCCRQHQKEHWKEHKSLCKAVQYVLQEYTLEDSDASDDWNNIKMNFMLLVSFRLGRRLTPDEVQMFMFPRECAACHEQNGHLLEDCRKCAASFCKNHKDGIMHRNICASLALCLRLDLLIMSKEVKSLDLPSLNFQRVSVTDTYQDMDDFMNKIIQPHPELSHDVLAAIHSEKMTRPLTVFHGMRLLNYVPKCKDLVIHVVAANPAEEITFLAWEILLHLIGTVTKLVIVLIGPELKGEYIISDICNDCILRGKKISSEFHNMLYENYVRSSLFVKPDLIVGFNTGIHAHELTSARETWAPSVQMLAKQNCPLILTGYTLQETEKDIVRINTILERDVDYVYTGKNPFASVRPHRILGLERMFYPNHGMIVYRSLCS